MIPPENSIVEAKNGLHMEILDTSTRQVWQALEPATREDYDALELEPPFIKVGIGSGAMDESYFRRSPGAAADGPMKTLELGGHTWSYCARPLEVAQPELIQPAGEPGPRRIRVDKHHSLVFHAGRSLQLIRIPDFTEYVHTIAGNGPLQLPDGWTLREIEVREKLTVHLPAPATAFFFPNRDSFQGPVEIEE